MVKTSTSCFRPVGFSSDIYFFKKKKARLAREERKSCLREASLFSFSDRQSFCLKKYSLDFFGFPTLQRSHSLKRSARPFTLVLYQDKNEQQTNHLNLPTQIVVKGKTIGYSYDASGIKLKKTIGTKTTEYTSATVYKDGTLELIHTPEGYIEPTDAGYKYIYRISDHLGNTRVSFTKNETTNEIDVLQTNDYYPFGLTFDKPVQQASSSNIGERFKYNGKERDLELGWDDFGSRNYNPELGRWMNIDPKGELLEISSPYVYALNSPLVYIDEDGELPILINGKTWSDSERADESYWTAEIVNTIKNSGIANPGGDVHYVDGNRGHRWSSKMGGHASQYDNAITPSRRAQGGRYAAEGDWNTILSKLQRDPETGKIVEKIQIYTHSRGAAFGIGYTERLLELISENADQFADANNVIDYVFNMAPHQSNSLNAPDGVDSYSIDHTKDWLSGNDMKGLKGAFTSDEGKGGIVPSAHSMTSFKKDLNAFTSAFLKGNTSQKVIDNFINTMKDKYGVNVIVKQ